MILTHDRPAELAKCVEAIAPQVDAILIIDNFSTPPASPALTQGDTPTVIVRDDTQPPNIARMWNTGLNRIEYSMKQIGVTRWDVAFLCDDVFAPAGWIHAISATMRSAGAGAGSTHGAHPIDIPVLKVNPDRDLHNRMVGAAFMIVGENHQRADERMHWWWCDTDMDWQARLHFGGMVLVPGPVAVNTRPNDFTVNVEGLAAQAGRDGEEFAAKWGGRPW
jgi:hypothetical protein